MDGLFDDRCVWAPACLREQSHAITVAACASMLPFYDSVQQQQLQHIAVLVGVGSQEKLMAESQAYVPPPEASGRGYPHQAPSVWSPDHGGWLVLMVAWIRACMYKLTEFHLPCDKDSSTTESRRYSKRFSKPKCLPLRVRGTFHDILTGLVITL